MKLPKIRKKWRINPATRVEPDKRRKLSDKAIAKRLRAVQATHGIWKDIPDFN